MRPLALLLALLLAGPAAVQAAEAPAEEGDTAEVDSAGREATAQQDEDEEASAAAEEAGEGEAEGAVTIDDTFIPSTQISEDLSVSFPVDI